MSRLRRPLLLAMAVLGLAMAGLLQRQLNWQRAAMGLTRVAPLENAPPVLAFTTVALGSFRGLIANALWIRANDLQLDGKYFEQVQIADWITKLQPTFAQVWVVQAWNMAYNISVKFRDPADRWRWVQRGIELLRDEGLRYNPGETLLYRELAWFYQHKIGQNLDDAHLFYKKELADEMTRALGGGRPNFEELLNPGTDEARRRAALLRERYRMDPAIMRRVDQTHGPLDWRLPEATAIYWAFVGLERSARKELITLRRVIYQSLQVLVLRGRIAHVTSAGEYIYGPDLSKIPAAHEGYERMIAEEAEKPYAIQSAHRNFLKEVVFQLYSHNRLAEAERWMAVLREKYPEAVPPGQTAEAYALERLTANIRDVNLHKTRSLILSLLLQHFQNLVIDEDDHAAGLDNMARQIWRYYDEVIGQRREAVRLQPFAEMKGLVLADLLDSERGLPREYAARLATKLGVPLPAASTNAAPRNP